MYQLRQTSIFAKWLAGLRDAKAKARILARLKACLGNLGDTKALGGGIRELRVHVGAVYRAYFVQRRNLVLVLLCGGSKSSQSHDIKRAKSLLVKLDDG